MTEPADPNDGPKQEDKDTLKQVSRLVAELPAEQQQELARLTGQLTNIQTTISSSFSGPLPPPGVLAEYEKVLAGLPSKIVAMAEKEQGMREKSQDYQVDLQRKASANERLKTYGAIFFTAALFSVAGLATYLGNPVIAVPLGLAGFGSALLQFILKWSGRAK